MVTIRDAVIDDLPEMLRIYNYAAKHLTATFDLEEQTLDQRKPWFDSHGGKYPLIVAESEGCVVGYCSLSPFQGKEAYASTVEISIYISSNQQGKGVGKSLMKEIIERAKVLNYRTIIAAITVGNEASVKLHEKFGFTFAGRLQQVGYKFEQWLDVEYYQLIIKV